MSNSSTPAPTPGVLPEPPPPGSSTRHYGYPALGPDRNEFLRQPIRNTEDGSTVVIEGENWLGIDVSYIVETRWFNDFRAERLRGHDRVVVEETLGRTRVCRDGDICWTEQEVITHRSLEMAFTEVVRFEIWRVNTTLEAYYEFLTGGGGVAVDVGVGAAGIGAKGTSMALAAEAAVAAESGILGAGGMASTLGSASVLTAAAAEAIAVLGVGILAYQATTQAIVSINGDAHQASSELLEEGWAWHRTFWQDPIEDEDSPTTTWRRIVEPHPCSESDRACAEEAHLVIPARGGTGSLRHAPGPTIAIAMLLVLAVVGVVLVTRGGDPSSTDTAVADETTTSAAPTTTTIATTTSSTAPPPPAFDLSSITAVLVVPRTTYAVSVNGDPETLTFNWSGANCGEATSDGAVYRWTHDAADCSHAVPDHPDATIQLVVTDGTTEIRCTYQGAGTGSGPECERVL